MGYYAAFAMILASVAYLFFSTTPVGTRVELSTPPPAENGETQQYTINTPPIFTDVIQLEDLPSKHLPDAGKNRRGGRLIVVGDVHGMLDELVDLLAKVEFDKHDDHLVLAGDMISKGPDSRGVVDLAMKLGATGVRGNHEDRVLLAHARMAAEGVATDTPGASEDTEEEIDASEAQIQSSKYHKDRALIKRLGEKRIRWLSKCPVILRVGKIGSMGEVVVVHAGLTPGVRLEDQDASMAMTMRSVSKDGQPSIEGEGTKWAKIWNQYQKSLPKHDRSTVIYGHDSKRGLQIGPYSMGIDTGCLKGGRLTAVILEGENSKHTSRLVHVDCKDGRSK